MRNEKKGKLPIIPLTCLYTVLHGGSRANKLSGLELQLCLEEVRQLEETLARFTVIHHQLPSVCKRVCWSELVPELSLRSS